MHDVRMTLFERRYDVTSKWQHNRCITNVLYRREIYHSRKMSSHFLCYFVRSEVNYHIWFSDWLMYIYVELQLDEMWVVSHVPMREIHFLQVLSVEN